MGAGPHLDGVPLEQLMLVRVQSGLEGVRADAQGRLVLSRHGSGRVDSMNTFHFALNGAVANHVMGKFDHAIAFVAPLQQTCAIDGQRPAGLDGADTYFHADANREMTLADATIIVPAGTQLPAGIAVGAVFYEPGPDVNAMLDSRNAAIAQEMGRRNAPLRTVSTLGWREGDFISPDEYRALGQALGCTDLKRTLHMNSPDGSLEVHFGMFAEMKRQFSAGTRLWTNDDGVQYPILEECEERLAAIRDAASQLKAQTGCPHAERFYGAKLQQAQTIFERMQVLQQMEIKALTQEKTTLPDSPKEWHIAVDNQPVGPLSVADVGKFAQANPVTPATLIWRAGMAAWTPASLVHELHEAAPKFALPPPPMPWAAPPVVGSSLMELAQESPFAIFSATVRAPEIGTDLSGALGPARKSGGPSFG